VRAFGHFGGVPHRVAYDNLTPAVRKIIGAERALTDRFPALASHYLFEPCLARPGEGHAKGGVESRGKAIRLQHLTPIPCGDTLKAISTTTRTAVEQASQVKENAEGKTVWARFLEERQHCRALPAAAFEARRTQCLLANNRAVVQIEGAKYSVPSTWAGRQVPALIGVEEIQLRCHDELQVYAKQPRGGQGIQYRHYLPELARKPQALRQVAPELLHELGEPYRALWSMLTQTHGERNAARVFAKIVAALVEHGEGAVTAALASVLQSERAALSALRTQMATITPPARIAVPEPLAGYEIEAGKASDYDFLLEGSLP
jgi:hypothetical protein